MPDYFELIPYETTNFLLVAGRETCCVPHLHRELELALVLDGTLTMNTGGDKRLMRPGELWLINPYQCHEMTAPDPRAPFTFL